MNTYAKIIYLYSQNIPINQIEMILKLELDILNKKKKIDNTSLIIQIIHTELLQIEILEKRYQFETINL